MHKRIVPDALIAFLCEQNLDQRSYADFDFHVFIIGARPKFGREKEPLKAFIVLSTLNSQKCELACFLSLLAGISVPILPAPRSLCVAVHACIQPDAQSVQCCISHQSVYITAENL